MTQTCCNCRLGDPMSGNEECPVVSLCMPDAKRWEPRKTTMLVMAPVEDKLHAACFRWLFSDDACVTQETPPAKYRALAELWREFDNADMTVEKMLELIAAAGGPK